MCGRESPVTYRLVSAGRSSKISDFRVRGVSKRKHTTLILSVAFCNYYMAYADDLQYTVLLGDKKTYSMGGIDYIHFSDDIGRSAESDLIQREAEESF